MPARVTQGMINAQLMRNLSSNLQRMDKWQNQLTTGRRINAPSDDPVGITFSLRYRTELAANDQYQRNVDSAISALDYVDTTMNQAGEVMQRLRELAVSGATDTNPQTARDAIKNEVKQLYDQLVGIGNSSFNGKFVFNGQLTDTQPYSTEPISDDPDAIHAQDNSTDTGEILYQLGAGTQIATNITGDSFFGAAGDEDNAFQVITDLYNSLNNGDTNGVSQALGKIDSRIDKMLQIRSEVGARSNRIELIQQRLTDIDTNLQALQSKTEDADIPGVITNLKMAENVYQSSLSVGAQLIKPSLVDFLK
ncbi:flagellar hook-associated protein FlgL [Paenibacillus cymbidii]|uniref:flagellar hook-associated protein FlgL n=1 Tax=Paenibacillus cymbidii TaxID=1639034 RepID=UPI001081A2F0|nr:flagellar hook-associated protein FlgL [Paenibacillus cymbidii]